MSNFELTKTQAEEIVQSAISKLGGKHVAIEVQLLAEDAAQKADFYISNFDAIHETIHSGRKLKPLIQLIHGAAFFHRGIDEKLSTAQVAAASVFDALITDDGIEKIVNAMDTAFQMQVIGELRDEIEQMYEHNFTGGMKL